VLQYPVLLDDARQEATSLAGKSPFVVGRSADADLPVVDLSCSRRQFRLLHEHGNWFVEAVSDSNPTFLDNQRIVARSALTHGAVIGVGNSRFRFLERPLKLEDQNSPGSGATHFVRPMPSVPIARVRDMTSLAGECISGESPVAAITAPVELSGTVLIGREADRVQLVLPHAQVSRLHAQVQMLGRSATITDLRSANGTFVNGRRLNAPASLWPGDRIDIGPYTLAFTGTAFVPRSRENNIELIGHSLTRVVTDPQTGQARSLLDFISIVVRPREFVCILGPSGSGKSTLLSALSARVPMDTGRVLINGNDLYANFDSLKQDIVVVPQKDVLHETLTVEQAISYTAELRLPADTSRDEIQAEVNEILVRVAMTTHRHTAIGKLSGGQIKRASLANELLGRPTLIFLDEVTSGLDEQTDRDMMGLFRSLAEDGKTVVCITHSLANVEKYCHLVVILAEGGRLAFVGTPEQATRYFEIPRLGDVYEKLATRSAVVWKDRFAASPFFTRYISERLPERTETEPEPIVPVAWPLAKQVRESARQCKLMARRYVSIVRGDSRSLLLMAAQCVVVAALLVILFGDLREIVSPAERGHRTATLTFLLAVSCFWFGCNNAAKEFIKERFIYRRERDCNLGLGAYYLAKFGILVGITWTQTLFVWGVIAFFCCPTNPILATTIVLLTLAATGVALGLAISAIVSSEDMAVTAIPIVLLPQIILADAIAPVSGIGKLLGQLFVSCYWGVRGLNAVLPEETVASAGLKQHDAFSAYAALVLQGLVLVFVGMGVMYLRDKRDVRFGRAVAAWLQIARQRWSEQADRLSGR